MVTRWRAYGSRLDVTTSVPPRACRAVVQHRLLCRLARDVENRVENEEGRCPGWAPPFFIRTIGVNAYLWRAALETVSFAPLLQSDSNGGVIVTDWYANPKNPGERVKLTVSILDQDLRADAVRVAASRQVSQGGQWVDAPVQAATVQRLEDIILTKARELRRQAIAG